MKLIPLTQGKFAQVDDEDYDHLMQRKWYYRESNKTGYAVSKEYGREIQMHRVIMMPFDVKFVVDHINRNGIDNQRSNLRLATTAQNGWNSKKRKDCVSNYKGVRQRTEYKTAKWRAMIKIKGVLKTIGTYDTEIEAAKAWDTKAKEIHGEFACLNFPDNIE